MTTMNHDEAVRDHLAEGYLLGDLSIEARDAFEEHYFDCQACANDVRTNVAFAGALRAERENPFLARQVARMKRRFIGSLAAAASVLLALLGYVQMGAMKQAAMLHAALLPKGAAIYTLRSVRAGRPEIARSGMSILQLDVPLEVRPASGTVTCLIIDSNGRPHGEPITVSMNPEDTGPAVRIVEGTLPPGDYAIRVDGLTQPVAPYTFRVP